MNRIEEMLESATPGLLVHYTRAAGLRGILESGTVWCSSALHMNDAREFRFALDTIVKRAVVRSAGLSGERLQQYQKFIEDLHLSDGLQAFVASFSGNSDSLSQWLAYSGEGSGYAVQFTSTDFAEVGRAKFTSLATPL